MRRVYKQISPFTRPLLCQRLYSSASPYNRNILFTDHRTRMPAESTSDPMSLMMRQNRPPRMLTPADLKQDVRQEYVRTGKSRSPQLETLPRLSSILKGFRPNELTIFTGPTGSGKTTVLSQISLDLAAQKVPVLWGSFEVKNARLVQAMLQQIATEPIAIESEPTEEGVNRIEQSEPERLFECAYDRLAQMPVHLMNVFGSTPLDQVIAGMEESVQERSIHLIILDNLQFMLSGQTSGGGNFDKFDLVDQSIAAVRSFCNRHPVHVILVVHPRKEMDETSLGLCSVSGTAKATQEADNVVILQKLEGNRRFLEVKKNRFDGELGKVPIGFLRESRMIYELEEDEERAQRK